MSKFGESMRGLTVFIADIRNCESYTPEFCLASLVTHLPLLLLQVNPRKQRGSESTRNWQTLDQNLKVCCSTLAEGWGQRYSFKITAS